MDLYRVPFMSDDKPTPEQVSNAGEFAIALGWRFVYKVHYVMAQYAISHAAEAVKARDEARAEAGRLRDLHDHLSDRVADLQAEAESAWQSIAIREDTIKTLGEKFVEVADERDRLQTDLEIVRSARETSDGLRASATAALGQALDDNASLRKEVERLKANVGRSALIDENADPPKAQEEMAKVCTVSSLNDGPYCGRSIPCPTHDSEPLRTWTNPPSATNLSEGMLLSAIERAGRSNPQPYIELYAPKAKHEKLPCDLEQEEIEASIKSLPLKAEPLIEHEFAGCAYCHDDCYFDLDVCHFKVGPQGLMPTYCRKPKSSHVESTEVF